MGGPGATRIVSQQNRFRIIRIGPEVVDNRQLFTTITLCLLLFFVFQFLDPFGMKKPAVDPLAVRAEAARKDQELLVPTFEPRKFLTLGSLAPDSNQCLLATFDSQGAAVRRIELVQRDAQGRFLTREIEDKTGYLGYLELLDGPEPGCQIQTLPLGSPLTLAQGGDVAKLPVRVGDHLLSVAGQAIESDADLTQVLSETKGGQTVEVVLARALPLAALLEGSGPDATTLPPATPENAAPENAAPENVGEVDTAAPGQPPVQPQVPLADAPPVPLDEASPLDEGGALDNPAQESGGAVVAADPLQALSAEPQPAEAASQAPLVSWEQFSVTVTLMDRPKKLLGPEYRFGTEADVPYPGTLDFTLVDASNVDWRDLDLAMRRGNWQASQGVDPVDGRPFVAFTYTLPPAAIKRLNSSSAYLSGIEVDDQALPPDAAAGAEPAPAGNPAPAGKPAGSITVVKRYKLPQVPAEQLYDPAAAGYHIDLDVAIYNTTPSPKSLAYRLNGPVATAIEGWWYQIKLHGGFWKIGYAAGARDIITSTAADPYDFHGRAEMTSEFRKGNSYPLISAENPEPGRSIKFVAVDNLYFASAVMPALPGANAAVESPETPIMVDPLKADPWTIYSAFGGPVGVVPPTGRDEMKADISFRLYDTIDVLPQGMDEVPSVDSPAFTPTQSFRLFAGPKREELLAKYGLQDAVSFGWFGLFSQPLCWLLHAFYYIFRNYGIAIVALTILVRLLMMPISRQAVVSAQMMQALGPEIKKIKEQYPDDMEKQGTAQRELFRRAKYNPLGGCGIMFLQLPIFIGLYRGLSVDFELRDQALIPGVEWCSNLAAPDQLFNWSGYLPEFLAGESGWLGPYFNLLPIITIVLFIFQQKMFTPPPTDEQQAMMQKMMSFMMIFMGFMFFKVPAGLCLYFITSSIWGLVERVFIPKPQLSQSMLDGLGLEAGGKTVPGTIDGKVIKSSAGATRMDDQAKRAQRDQQRERQKRLRDKRNDV